MVLTAMFSAAALAALAAPQPMPRPAGTARTDLQRHDLSVPGWESIQALVSFAPGSSFPRHKHPGEEIIYVTQGTIEYEVAGKWVTVKAGEVLFVPDGVVHAVAHPAGVLHRRQRGTLRRSFAKKPMPSSSGI